MTNHTCTNCGFSGEVTRFKNGLRGRKIHEECDICRAELAALVDEYRMLQMYLSKYKSAYSAIKFGGEILENFKSLDLTPSYLKGGEFLGTMHDSHFVPISNLAFEHARLDLKSGIDLQSEIQKALGGLLPVEQAADSKAKPWDRQSLKTDIKKFESIPTGKGEVNISNQPKKGFFRRLFGG